MAATMAGASMLAIECQPDRIEKRLETGYLDRRADTLDEAMAGADLFVGLSGPGILSVEHLKTMNRDGIVFAMSNPTPEIMPEEAWPHIAVMATGRSDYPNQLNNVLCFPGIFRGALDCRAARITEAMKLAAAQAIADTVPEESLSADYIIPGVFNKDVARNVAQAVENAAATEAGDG